MSMLKLKDLMDKNHETIRHLSKSTGITRQTIHRMVDPHKDFDPKLSSLIAVANHFNCKIEDLIDEKAYARKEKGHEIN